MLSLLDWPKTTGQIAEACGLSLAHASRAVRELSGYRLVQLATPDLAGRGRLYALTADGRSLADSLDWNPRVRSPMVRSTHPKAWYEALVAKIGESQTMKLMRDLDLVDAIESPSGRWILLRNQIKLLEEVERRFGDGSYRLVEELATNSVQYYPSVRRYLFRALPWRVILEIGGSAYLREFNHGRVEVEIHGSEALAKHFDWLSSPARCAAWLGSWKGLIRLRRLEGTVEKQDCMLEGDDFCGYRLAWQEGLGSLRKKNGLTGDRGR